MIMAKYTDQTVSHNILNDSELIELQNFLSQYTKDTVPVMYFKVWNILVLGVTNYEKFQELLIKQAWIKFKGL